MAILLLFICIYFLPNLMAGIAEERSPFLERNAPRFLLISSSLYFLSLLFLSYSFILKGVYTFTLISLFFLASIIVYSAVCTNTGKKILILFVLFPFYCICLLSLFFGRKMDEFKVNDNHKIILSSGGMLSAGEELTVVRSGYFIFDKKLTDINNICLAEIQDTEN
ncbi:MAG TPA: hypothetical protein PK637_06565 [Flavobacteriales bacterium]|nr:hypothetical protein [Flavobacteriales bacterium]HRE96410.1 hypothetical protein [Flavobacteriales bacterium]